MKTSEYIRIIFVSMVTTIIMQSILMSCTSEKLVTGNIGKIQTISWNGQSGILYVNAPGETYEPIYLMHANINQDSVLKSMYEDSLKYSHLFH